jgi:ABC-2 type transport system permease protein
MKKIINIAWKDVLITISDPAALVLTLVTPFVLTLVMLFAFGGSDDSGITGIPVVIVNLDESDLGKSLVEVFESDDLADLVKPTLTEDPEAARAAVDNNEFAAAVIIPVGLGDTLMPSGFSGETDVSNWGKKGEQAVIEIYGNPTRLTSVSVVRTIVDEFINRATAMILGTQVSIQQMLKSGMLSINDLQAAFIDAGQFATDQNQTERLITLKGSMVEGSLDPEFDWLGYMAPSMAILFLMFTVTNGGRSILSEREGGTLPRMLTTPSGAAQVIGGKIFGIYLNGIAQLTILMVASLVFFQMRWGSLGVVIPTILCLVAAATGWGMLIASFSKTPGQANAIGTAVTLVFAISAGNFIPRFLMPDWLQKASFISPNAWGLETFNQIRLGATATELLPYWGAMLGMFVVLLVAAVIAFRRQYS